MDFMLEMYSKDHPNEYTFNREGHKEPDPMIFKLWADKLRGKTLTEFSLSPVLFFRKNFGADWKK